MKINTGWMKNIHQYHSKLIIMMAFIAVSMFSIMNNAHAQSDKKILFEADGITLKKAFESVEKLSGNTIAYNNTQLNDQKKVYVSRGQRSVGEVMELLLKGLPFSYKISGNNIVIAAKNMNTGKLTGLVVDEANVAIPAVTIKVVELNLLVQTNNNGEFNLNVAPGVYTVEARFISYETARKQLIKVSNGLTTKINFTLKSADNSLNEVVVTALGIKREERALGYANTTVKGEALTNAISGNWLDALSGKVAGLNLIRSNGGPTGSIKVVLRGESDLSGSSEALIVVDGVAISGGSGRSTAIAGESVYGTSSDNMPADYGSGLNDINPEDIESVSILKGPGAAALYGERGRNGAILITTKSGNPKRKGLGITVNSNASFESMNRSPDLQYEYGQGLAGADYYSYGAGADGASTSGTSSAYGPRFNGQMFYQYDPVTQKVGTERTPWVPYVNGVNDFFKTGQTYTNSVSVDGGTDKTTARFSFTNVDNKWITPNTGYGRNSVALSVNSKVNDKLTISSKINYTNKFSDNLPGAGYGNQSLMYWYIFWQPNADPNGLRNYWKTGQEGRAIQYPFSSFPENPYAISYEFINKSIRNGMTGNVQAAYSFTKELSLQVRTSLDFSYEQREQDRPYDAGTKLPKGSYRTQNIYSQEASTDFLLRYNKKVSKDFELTATAGGSMLKNKYIRDEIRADSLIYPGLYSFSNAAGPLVTLPLRNKYATNSFYGLLSLTYKNYLYLDLTGRKDWSSILATPSRTDNVGFFYPSASLSFILSEVVKLPEVVNYTKLRASYSQVGGTTNTPYITSYSYPSAAGGLYTGGALQNPVVLPNPDLLPLTTSTYELGADIRLFKNRLNFDFAMYAGNSKNQILYRILDRSTGYNQMVINAGRVDNRGIELAVNGTIIKGKDFSWNANFTYAANRNKIVDINGDSSVVLRTGPVAGGQVVAKVGGSMGDLYGRGFVRSPDGQIVYDATTGTAKITDDVVYLGNTSPKFKTSFGSEFRYKQFRLNVLFDAQVGAVAHSLTNYKLVEQGKTTNTLPGRYNGIIGTGVVQNADGTYRQNDVVAYDVDAYYRAQMGADNAEGSTFSTDFLKFREARLDYTLTPKLTKKLGLQRASVGVYGRDLFIWSPWPIFDPEFGTLSGTDIVQGFETAQFPSTRTFGVTLTVGF